MMKEQKNLLLTSLIYGILFVVFNVLVFVIFKNRTDVFWMSYSFMTLAIIVQLVCMLLSFKNADLEAVFFGIPLASLGIFYLIAELAVGTIFMCFQQIGTTIPLVIQVLILAIFAITAIIALMARDTVQEIGNTVKEKVVRLKSVRADVEILFEGCTEPELKNRLRKLLETIRYSDPMTNDAIVDVEERIQQKVLELRIYCENSEVEEAKKTCSALELLYVERNKKLLISK